MFLVLLLLLLPLLAQQIEATKPTPLMEMAVAMPVDLVGDYWLKVSYDSLQKALLLKNNAAVVDRAIAAFCRGRGFLLEPEEYKATTSQQRSIRHLEVRPALHNTKYPEQFSRAFRFACRTLGIVPPSSPTPLIY